MHQSARRFTRVLPTFRLRTLLPALLPLALAGPGTALAAPVRVVASDARGVTLQVTVGAWSLSDPGRDGRVIVTGLPESHSMSIPGRPLLPAYSAMLALPPDARPTARVLAASGEQAREGALLAIAGKPVFRDETDSRMGPQPGVEAVAAIDDGPWPASQVELGRPFGFRGRRMVTLEVRPFRYDAASRRLSAPLTLTVRVDFNRPGAAITLLEGAGEPDRHVDAALETSVLNWQQGQGWRVPPQRFTLSRPGKSLFSGTTPTAAQALGFDESEPEVRVKLPETALYRLSYEDLAQKGYPAGVPVGEVSVHRHEYLEGAVPPYGTVELACEVQDANGDGTFDSGDGVLVWVRNWAERSKATNIRRFWGDAEVVFVTRKPGGGLRVAQRSGWNNLTGLTPLTSYPYFRHFEHDFASTIMQFVSTPADTNIGLWQWTTYSFYYDRPDTIRIETNDIDTSQTATVTTHWVGRAYGTNFMWAALRNGSNQVTSIADSVNWFNKTAVSATGSVHGSALTEGNTNFFRQWGKNQFGPPDPNTNGICFAGLDWFDLTYWRRYRAIKDYVRFNSAGAGGDFQLSVGGFSNDSLRVYDVTDPDNPVRIDITGHVTDGATVSFDMQDVATTTITNPDGHHDYVAAALQRPADPALGPKAPPSSAYSLVTRRNLYANTSGDYLLVAPEEFISATTQLSSLRRSQGLSVVEAPIESIYDEFDGGRHSAAALERFAKYGYAQWNTRFLMLVGDGTLDPNHNVPTSGADWIPVLPTPGPVGASEGLEIVPSDNRYGFITGADDPISGLDSNRVVPELMVGRLTVNSLADAYTVIGKIVGYEDLSTPDAWRRDVLLNADDAFSGENASDPGAPTGNSYCHHGYEELFVSLGNTMRSYILSDSGVAGMNVEEFNLRSYLTNEPITFDPVTGDTCRPDRNTTQSRCHAGVTPILIGKLNAGQLLWNFQGHANEFVLTHESLFDNQGADEDALRLQNDGKPFLFTAFSCHANMFARPFDQFYGGTGPCLGENLLAQPNGRGAVASWASVCFEVVPRDDHTHVNVELIRSMFVFPPRDEFLGADDRGSRVVLGEAILSALFRYVGTTQSYPPERGLAITYTLLGDPATRISIGHPFNLVTANGLTVSSGTPLRLHTLGDTLRLDADVVSNVRLDSLAVFVNRGTGEVPVPNTDYTVSPAFPDTAGGGVFGGRHFRVVYRTQPEANSADYIVMVKDKNGLVQRTVVVLKLDGVLRSSNAPINDGDPVAPNAQMSLQLLSPRPLASPQTEIALTINGQAQAFTATPAPGDVSNREWILSWTHADYPIDDYAVMAAVQNGGTITHHFKVTASSGQLAVQNLIPFPNPFDNSGLHFSFLLAGGENADVKVHVFTESGRSIYTNVVRGLSPGYHQLAWDGHDAEGDELANGTYFFRLSATTTSGATTQQLGRLVKLRRPHHTEEPVVP
jgi:hypothetical protein